METVLVVGATGNIGVAAVIGALRSGLQVLAVVRNQESAKKLFQHVGAQERIFTVEADILSEHGIQGVVDKVRLGQLPAFQHVYGAGMQPSAHLCNVTVLTRSQLEEHMELPACKILESMSYAVR
jgi:NAD(P)-dependent dehydrogenase (short-subunit alcohol dehydrogenase family)